MEDSGTESDDETETEQGEEADSDSKCYYYTVQYIPYLHRAKRQTMTVSFKTILYNMSTLGEEADSDSKYNN